jgi:hypothetical protein
MRFAAKQLPTPKPYLRFNFGCFLGLYSLNLVVKLMRFLIIFIIGVLSGFYLSALLHWVTNKRVHSAFGFLLIIVGGLNIFFTLPILDSPLRLLISAILIGAGMGSLIHHLLSESYLVSEKIEKNFISKHENKFERILEILPGALTWLALTSPIWLSFTLPFAVAYLILIADIYWLFNSFKISLLVYLGYKKMREVESKNWLSLLEKDFPNEWQDYYHLIVLPSYKESLQILGPAFDAIANSEYPKQKIFLAVGFEAWANQDEVKEITEYLNQYKTKIGGVFTTIHELQLGEVKGPGTNRNWIMRNAQKEFSKLKIDPKQVIVTTLDADFVIHKQFLAGAIHKYLSTPENIRNKRSYTGVFLYYNNYWQTPAPMRLIAIGTAFWQLAEMVGSDKYINYSSLSMNMQSILDVGLWFPNKVNDDSGFYWRAYYHFNGDYKVIPHFMPITADAVLDITLPKTFQNQYLQLKRWAYGVEHIPFIVKQYFRKEGLDFWDKTDKLIFIIWSYLKWGTLALFISFGGILIPLINPQFSQSVVSYNLTVISSWILTAAFTGLFTTIIVHEKTCPPRPKNWSALTKIWSYIQWALVPIVLVTIATIPAIDAQTSLMMGRYLEYRVTNKARIND